MTFRGLTNTPLDRARQDYFDILIQNGMSPKSEVLPVTEAAGRVTAAPIYAKICVPLYNTCAMDGIALDARITLNACETTPVLLTADLYKKVNTGDLLPHGCDAVVMIEDVFDSNDCVKLFKAATPGQHIRQIGEDICAGEMLLPSCSLITPAAAGAMVASGITEIEVIKRPVVGIIPTDDNHIPPIIDHTADAKPDHNSVILSAMLHEWGAETMIYQIVKDDFTPMRTAIRAILAECDAVILCAGSSAVSESYATNAIADAGAVLYHGLAIKPGKPAILGYSGQKPLLGVPRHHVSSIIVAEELLRPVVEYLCGKVRQTHEYVDAILSKAIVSTLKYQEFVRVHMGYVKGRLVASPLSRGSGIATSFMRADGIVEVPQDIDGYKSGAQVKVRLLRPVCELERNIVAIGSHDPLFDELAELLRVMCDDVSMTSSHIGSMGGIMAVRHEEAHLAGIHLLDETTGEYNTSFVKKYFPNMGVRLVECVNRSQGLIVQRGNPKNITDITDLTRDGLRYVNRQKGSGTRILIDYLCRKYGIDTSKIYSYHREEYTHTSVAALIAADSADAGLGIYSTAKMYDLDFIPVCNEQYDLLIPDYAWDTPMMQCFLEILRSNAFRQRLAVLGGYTIKTPGNVREIWR